MQVLTELIFSDISVILIDMYVSAVWHFIPFLNSIQTEGAVTEDDDHQEDDHHEFVLGIKDPFELTQSPFDVYLLINQSVSASLELPNLAVQVNVLDPLLDLVHRLHQVLLHLLLHFQQPLGLDLVLVVHEHREGDDGDEDQPDQGYF